MYGLVYLQLYTIYNTNYDKQTKKKSANKTTFEGRKEAARNNRWRRNHFLKQILSTRMTGASNRADMTKAEPKETTALPRNVVNIIGLFRCTVPLMCDEQMNMMIGWMRYAQ